MTPTPSNPGRLANRQSRQPGTSLDAVIGISGARRNPAAAIVVDGHLRGFCEQERLSRIRGTSLRPGDSPHEAIAAVLALAGIDSAQLRACVVAEDGVIVPDGWPSLRLDHHQSHAATAFLTSPFDEAAILVCDRTSRPEVSLWLGRNDEVLATHWPWTGQGFASLFSEASRIFGFGEGQEHRLEALARLDPGLEASQAARLIRFSEGKLHLAPDWKRDLSNWLHQEGPRWSLRHGAQVAACFQQQLGRALLEVIGQIRLQLGASRLCLGGGLFYNTFLNTLIAEQSEFDEVFIAPNPGNAGIAAGAALSVGRRKAADRPRGTVSPFLGPAYSDEDIKATLDNCKLSYEYLREDDAIDVCVEELAAGRIVGWFDERMEWAHRALGNRSILASPFSPYVLENLNGFLKQREPYRAYGLSVCTEDQARHFDGPSRSVWMEYEYRIQDPDSFRHVTPLGATSLRVQSVEQTSTRFWNLHKRFSAVTGKGVLVNTSFNGFSEPIVCSPRDAIRVFYGTGIDALFLGRFVIRK